MRPEQVLPIPTLLDCHVFVLSPSLVTSEIPYIRKRKHTLRSAYNTFPNLCTSWPILETTTLKGHVHRLYMQGVTVRFCVVQKTRECSEAK